MTKKFAPSGATGSACLSDLVTLDRGYLDSIVALLRDPTACRGPGMMKIVDGFEQAIATTDLLGTTCNASVGLPDGGYVILSAPRMADLETSVAAIRAAFEPPADADDEAEFWSNIDRRIDERWAELSSVGKAYVLPMRRWASDFYTPFKPQGFDDLRAAAGADPVDDPAFQDHIGPASESPEAAAEAKLAARDARRPKVKARIEWGNGGVTAIEGDTEAFADLIEGLRSSARLSGCRP